MDIISKFKDNKEKIIEAFCYILILVNFLGVDFLRISIFGINMNLGRILMAMAAVILVLIFIKNKNIKDIKETIGNKKNVSFVIKFLLIWVLFSIISSLATKDISNTIIVEYFFIFGTASILLIFFNLQKKENFIRIFKITEIAMFINVIWTFYLYNLMGVDTYGGLYYNINDLATFFLFGIPVEVALICMEKDNKKLSIIRVIFLLIELYAFKLLNSRACDLGMILGIMAIIVAILYKKNDKIKKIREVLMNRKLMIVIILLALLVCAIGMNKILKPSLEGLSSSTVRINLIYNGLHFPNQNYILGIGSGNMCYYLENYGIYPTKNITDLHNYWLEIFIDYGVIIFAFFIISYIKVVIELLENYSSCKDSQMSKIYLTCIFFIGAFLIACISSSNNLTKEWLWILAGIILSIINLDSNGVLRKE